MAYLLLDTNAVYDLVRRKNSTEMMLKLAKAQNFQLAVAPMVLVECVTRAFEKENFLREITKPAFKKLKSLQPVILADQDKLLESMAYGDLDLVNHDENWEKILNHFYECEREGVDFVYKVGKKEKRYIHAQFIKDSRNEWEERYIKDWLYMLKSNGVPNADSLSDIDYQSQTKAINPDFLQSNKWENTFFEAMEERTQMNLSDKKQDILDMNRYVKQEFKTIWEKVINSGYRPFSKNKKNDYNDMSVMQYAGLNDVYVFSGDTKMADKTTAVQDGKLFIRGCDD